MDTISNKYSTTVLIKASNILPLQNGFSLYFPEKAGKIFPENAKTAGQSLRFLQQKRKEERKMKKRISPSTIIIPARCEEKKGVNFKIV
jgi:hypothetical protein